MRLAHNEPGLSRVLLRELRTFCIGQESAPSVDGERIAYKQLVDERNTLQTERERIKRKEEQARWL